MKAVKPMTDYHLRCMSIVTWFIMADRNLSEQSVSSIVDASNLVPMFSSNEVHAPRIYYTHAFSVIMIPVVPKCLDTVHVNMKCIVRMIQVTF